MNIRDQAFDAIAGDPVLWQQWNDARDEYDRSNMLIVEAYLLGIRHGRQTSKPTAKATSKDSPEVRNLISMGR